MSMGGSLSGVMKASWHQRELVVVQHMNRLNATELFTSKWLFYVMPILPEFFLIWKKIIFL